MGLERNYGAIENTFNAADRNSSAKGAKASPHRFAVATATYNAHVASTRREVHLQRKRSSHFQWPRPLYKVLLVSCRRFYSTALTRGQKKEVANSLRCGKTSVGCINHFSMINTSNRNYYLCDMFTRFTTTSF